MRALERVHDTRRREEERRKREAAAEAKQAAVEQRRRLAEARRKSEELLRQLLDPAPRTPESVSFCTPAPIRYDTIRTVEANA